MSVELGCKFHSKYMACLPPLSGCPTCWAIYKAVADVKLATRDWWLKRRQGQHLIASTLVSGKRTSKRPPRKPPIPY